MAEPHFLASLDAPSLILNEKVCRSNIRRMASKIRNLGIAFRPHFKTHQSRAVAAWFREEGIDAITVSSVEMAEYFADAGWDDITVAFPVNVRSVSRLAALANRIKLQVVVESREAVAALHSGAQLNPGRVLGAFIKVDAGYGRTGIPHEDEATLRELQSLLESTGKMEFRGFLCHSGHSYYESGREGILEVNRKEGMVYDLLKRQHDGVFISSGDTPGCSVASTFQGVDELRPGNFVFYDLDQWNREVCDLEEIAVAMACPVVAIHPAGNRVVIHGGAVHFCKDSLTDAEGPYFGLTVSWTNDGWTPRHSGGWLRKLSQEHGTVIFPAGIPSELSIGDMLAILPVHSCMTADSMAGYWLPGQGQVDHVRGQHGFIP